MKKLRNRAVVLFFLLFACLSLIISFLYMRTFRDQQINQHESALSRQVETFVSQITEDYETDTVINVFIPYIDDASERISERITLINADGIVIYDTHYDDVIGSDVSKQTEVGETMSGEELGVAIRPQTNSDAEVIFVAAPILSDTQDPLGYIRMGRPLGELSDSYWLVFTFLIILCLVATAVVTFFFYYWSNEIFKPLEVMKTVVEELSNENYSVRYRELNNNTYDEVNEIGEEINNLANNLETQMLELQQSNDRLNSLIQNLSVGVMLLDSERNIQLINPMISEILEESIVPGKSYIQYIKNPWLIEIVEDAYETGEIQVTEITFQTGEERLVDATAIPVDTQKDKNIIILLYDITEITRLERVRTDFVTNASHELKTPITALKGFTETLLEGAMDDRETLEKFLNIILKESERLDSIVGDILKLSKLEDSDTKINYETFDVIEPAKEVLDILKQKSETKSISVSIDEIKPTIVRSDFDLIKQILLNLINNAILYTPENGEVIVTIDHTATNALLIVEDNGMGIPKNEQDRVFERFYRVDKARSRNAGGTGLGLSIVKHIVENLGGTIQLDSQIGLGSEFTVSLPYSPELPINY